MAAHLQGLLEATGKKTVKAAVNEVGKANRKKRGFLRYDSCSDEDFDAFTYFRDREENDAFLEMINAKKNAEDDGECTRLLRFSLAKKNERRGGGRTRKRKSGGGRKRMLGWKDEYLAWSCYVHCGWKEKHVARLFGVAKSTVSDVVRTWSVYLDQALALLLPNPTKPEILRSYPTHFIRIFGHARVAINLDASDLEGQTARYSEAQSASYSTYHSQTGAKVLAGCTNTGAVPHPWVTDPHPSAVADDAMVKETKVLKKNLRRYDVANVDRGFCIENQAIEDGILISRPLKRMRGQSQFSAADGNKTHKVGTTRICIEQANSTWKQKSGYLQRVTPALQFDILGTIARVAYCMTNFSAPLTTGVHLGSTGNRACRAGVQWLGHNEPETIDARAEPKLWCSKSQLDLHVRLSKVLTESPELISELVLVETTLEKSASEAEKVAREKWVAWKSSNISWEAGEVKKAKLRFLAIETLQSLDRARKSAGRLGLYE